MVGRHFVTMLHGPYKRNTSQTSNPLKLNCLHIHDIVHAGHHDNIPAEPQTLVTLVKACAGKKTLIQAKEIHDHIILSGIPLKFFLASNLVSMYANCGSIMDACKVFDKMPERNTLMWNAMIRAYAMHGHCEEALGLYYEMQESGIHPDGYTFPCVLKACAGLQALQEGKHIHEFIRRSRFESVVYVGNALVDMYAKCGSMEDARQVFDRMPCRDVVSWNAMIGGYAQNGYFDEALRLFRQMQEAGKRADAVTVASMLRACIQSGALQWCREIHSYIVRNSFESNVALGNSLVAMYGKNRCIETARQVFDRICEKTVVSWNVMIAGYAQNGQFNEAVNLFCQMQVSGMRPDRISVVGVLQACALGGSLEQGKEVHGHIIKCKSDSDITVTSAIVDMYVKCGSMENARQVFEKMLQKDVVSWTAMIAGYAENGHGDQALKLFHQMQVTGQKPDAVTIASVLPACASLAVLQQGKEIHGYISRNGLASNGYVCSALIDMYAKCGNIKDARLVFDRMSHRDVTLWTAMIAGYAAHGYGHDALTLFRQMQKISMKPDYVTFIAILSACNHAGLVDEGFKYFYCMSRDYKIEPNMEHYACMVDLLGRLGHLNDAYDFVKNMPMKPNVSIWGALLGACRIHENIELGKCVAKHLLEIEPANSSNYVLLSNIYAATGRWEEAEQVRYVLKDRGLKKRRGCSWIEIKYRIHTFHAGDWSPPQIEENCTLIECLAV